MTPVRTHSSSGPTLHKCSVRKTATTTDLYQPYFMSLLIHAYALDFLCPTMAKDRDWLARLPFMKVTSVRTYSTPTQNMVRALRRLNLVKGRKARVACASNNEPGSHPLEQADGFLFDVQNVDPDCNARKLARATSMKPTPAEVGAGTSQRKREAIGRLSSLGERVVASLASQRNISDSLESAQSNVESLSAPSIKRVTFASFVEVQQEGEVVSVLLSEMDNLQQGRGPLQESSGLGFSRQQNERLYAEAAQQHPELQEVFDMFDSYTAPTV